MLLKIKEFAEFCSISVRALHLYDKLSLLKPAYTDTNNGYRYYDTKQMLELNTILSYKKVGFSLAEIMEIKERNYSKAFVISQLEKKKKENNKNIEILTYNNENIDTMLQSLHASKTQAEDGEEALRISKISCLENEKLEHDFSQILWL